MKSLINKILLTWMFLGSLETIKAQDIVIEPKSLPIKIYVDYTLSVEEAIKKGYFEYVNRDITSNNFNTEKSSGKDSVQAFLVYKKDAFSEEIVSWMKSNNMHPASLKELLALGIQYAPRPLHQRRYPVVALDSKITTDSLMVPALALNGGKVLGLYAWKGEWFKVNYFLGISNK